jgi:hypothetical protein
VIPGETLKVRLDGDLLEAISRQADAERRPINWQVEVALRRAFGLPFPVEPAPTASGRSSKQFDETANATA